MFESGITYMLTYIFTAFLTFTGLFGGLILAYMAAEELKPGKKYFLGLAHTIMVFIPLTILYSYGVHIALLVLLAISTIVFLYRTQKIDMVGTIAYYLLGIAFFFGTRSEELFIMTASMIFLLGLPLGSLFVAERIKESRKAVVTDMFLKYGLFLVVAFLTNLIALYVMNIF
ncbi:hypothetical protein HQ545_04580 [Candidatus Woesearchaeota archaeon]|nr:hypothetical protein [Candidatus Woesearchaeota archaeon]